MGLSPVVAAEQLAGMQRSQRVPPPPVRRRAFIDTRAASTANTLKIFNPSLTPTRKQTAKPSQTQRVWALGRGVVVQKDVHLN
jgi:hypothetical protein